jgi:hypothetical protein
MHFKALSMPVLAGAALSIPTPSSAQSCSFGGPFAHQVLVQSGQPPNNTGISAVVVGANSNSCP